MSIRQIARHVVKFADGSYLSPSLRYESRVTSQRHAMRWLTWASAKTIAEGTPFVGKGERAVHLKYREACPNRPPVCAEPEAD